MILFLFRTGVRVSELCALRRRDIDLADGTANIYRAKGGKSRTVHFDGETARRCVPTGRARRPVRGAGALPAFSGRDKPGMPGSAISPRTVEHIVAELCTRRQSRATSRRIRSVTGWRRKWSGGACGNRQCRQSSAMRRPNDPDLRPQVGDRSCRRVSGCLRSLSTASRIPWRIRGAACWSLTALAVCMVLAGCSSGAAMVPSRTASLAAPELQPARTMQTARAVKLQQAAPLIRHGIPRCAIGAKRVLVFLSHFNRRFVNVDASRCRRGMSQNRLNGRLTDSPAHELGGQTVAKGCGVTSLSTPDDSASWQRCARPCAG